MICILLADDQTIFRQGLAALLTLEEDFEIVGQAENGREAINLTASLQPDVVLMDVQMPICNGVEATREISQRFPSTKILVLTTFDDDEYIWTSLQAGASGYLLKRTPAEQMAISIRSVYKGYGQLGPTIAPKVFAQVKPPASNPVQWQEFLSRRELDVLKLVGQGKSNQEIASTLHLSEGTVKNYVTRILSSLSQFGVRDRVQAALWAAQNLDLA
ncbi:MAG: response regulator transcription factor [Leptolyngbya sp. SIO1D8]|nr:response regulator transcription factor [Leptolyngbya sp. SIO1D8]